jgi:hypothetical protein
MHTASVWASLTGTERDHLISQGASTPSAGCENGDNTVDKCKARHGHL